MNSTPISDNPFIIYEVVEVCYYSHRTTVLGRTETLELANYHAEGLMLTLNRDYYVGDDFFIGRERKVSAVEYYSNWGYIPRGIMRYGSKQGKVL